LNKAKVKAKQYKAI